MTENGQNLLETVHHLRSRQQHLQQRRQQHQQHQLHQRRGGGAVVQRLVHSTQGWLRREQSQVMSVEKLVWLISSATTTTTGDEDVICSTIMLTHSPGEDGCLEAVNECIFMLFIWLYQVKYFQSLIFHFYTSLLLLYKYKYVV